jgi:hypothetical protein
MDYTLINLDEAAAALEEVARDAEQSFGALTGRQLNWRPDAARWGVAQCLEHLLTSNRLMLQSARSALDGSQPRTLWQRLPVVTGFFGRLLIRSLTPTATRKMTAPPGARPAFGDIPDDVVRRFADQQREAARWMTALDAARAEQTIMTSPFIRVVTYSVLDACRLMVAHDRRHIEQARRVTRMAEFPG